MAWKEMFHHILQNFCCHWRRYRFVALVPIQFRQISVKVSGDKKLCSSGLLTDHRNDAIQGGGVVRYEVAISHVSEAPSCHHL